jgi:hypothetical protein
MLKSDAVGMRFVNVKGSAGMSETAKIKYTLYYECLSFFLYALFKF